MLTTPADECVLDCPQLPRRSRKLRTFFACRSVESIASRTASNLVGGGADAPETSPDTEERHEFTHDRVGEDSCAKIHNCPRFWPALQSGGAPVAGAGVNGALLSTITLAGGAKQVTYAGHPLYLYSEDSPGSTAYVGVSQFGGHWYALNAAGHAVK